MFHMLYALLELGLVWRAVWCGVAGYCLRLRGCNAVAAQVCPASQSRPGDPSHWPRQPLPPTTT